ncbi:MAG: hypothetical protein KKA52_03960, partial [Candidatus Omnitrophica bacterium]|nr:hypothetical protein [Candidatus Omnitrophota bacterium]
SSAAAPLSYAKNYKDGAMPRLLRPALQSKSTGRAWCGHARPTTTLVASKNKKENFQGTKTLSICATDNKQNKALRSYYQFYIFFKPFKISFTVSVFIAIGSI